MNTKAMGKLIEKLQEKAGSLRGVIASADEAVRKPPEGGDEVDQANAINEANERDAFRARAQAELDKIKIALTRYEGGVFGECMECGCEIGDRRLEANPAASMCFDCQSAYEAERRGVRRNA
jgi:DnaK suppressor protein